MKKILIILFLAMLFMFSLEFANAKILKSEKSASAYQEKAIDYFFEGNFKKALININKSIENFPDNPDYYFTRAGVYMLIGDYKQALNDYEKINNLTPNYKKEVNFFIELAQEASLNPQRQYNFNIFNIPLKFGGHIVELSKKDEKMIDEYLAINNFIDSYATSLEEFCSDSGYTPTKYLEVFANSTKKTFSNIPNIKENLEPYFYLIVENKRNENIKKAVSDRQKQIDEIKITKAQYCSLFDENAQEFVELGIEQFKKTRAKLFLD